MKAAKKLKVRILAADFNKEIVDAMTDAAEAEAEKLGLSVTGTTRVPGSYELPFGASLLLARRDCELLVVLGYIERGDTLHGEVMGHVVSRLLLELGLKHKKPIGLGIIGPGATLEQARERREGHARAAVRAALACANVAQALTTAR